ncbi:NfeD family protein [Herminiimonas glaciei]|uniref:NfeD family protein n=1 Tax=Herminiimonas glaciei TaxID=523788 RepID=A0ABW2I847_9BURK
MTDWMIWFAVACVLVILEMATGTFYLLMIGIGTAAGGLAALGGMGVPEQCLIAAAVAAFATFALRRSKFGRPDHTDAARDPNVNLDIGQTLEVGEWHQINASSYTARVMYRGALWDVELAESESPVPGKFVIREVQGSRLIVRNSDATAHA